MDMYVHIPARKCTHMFGDAAKLTTKLAENVLGLFVPGLWGPSGPYPPLSHYGCRIGVYELSGISTGVKHAGGRARTGRDGTQTHALLQGIADYITRCKQAIGKFESLVHQIHKNADDINSRLTLIESVNLFRFPIAKTEDGIPGKPGFSPVSPQAKEKPRSQSLCESTRSGRDELV